MKYMIRPSVLEDCYLLEPDVKQSDREECLASTGQSIMDCLLEGFERSDKCFTVLGRHGEISGMGGIQTIPKSSHGLGWILSREWSDIDNKVIPAFIYPIMDEYLQTNFSIGNFIDARNTTSISMLEHMGFDIITTIPDFGVGGLPFHWMQKFSKSYEEIKGI